MAQKKNKNAYKPPTGATSVQPAQVNKTKVHLDSKTETFIDGLYGATWQKYDSRPANLEGVFIILRWYNADKTWITLYVGQGDIRTELDRIFGASKRPSPISKYLSSVAKKDRKKIVAVKWIPYPDHELSMKEVMAVVAAKYNQGEDAPFNYTTEDKLPENYSILNY